MGGDSYCSSLPPTDDASLSSQDSPHDSSDSRLENPFAIKGAKVSDSGEFPDASCRVTSAAEKQRMKVYNDVLRSYEDLQPRIARWEEAKNKILSYTPGSWADKATCTDMKKLAVPKATSLLLIGPKASGKSRLVNRISRILEDYMFLPPRSQVSSSSSPGDGTYFLHEFMIPRNSGSFCLYDTPGLSLDSSENLETIKQWMREGVIHGELTISTDETKKGYSQTIAADFNNPLLSFKDDKPAVVVTHGDLLSLSDRARVRFFLGVLLGVPPVGQIFDIPEDNDPSTTLAVFDMLIYCLHRADRNLPPKLHSQEQDEAILVFGLVLAVIAGIFMYVVLLTSINTSPHE